MADSPVRKIPTRRCTGCGEHFPKNTLIRVLRTPDGQVVLDLTGKKARKTRRIETSLEVAISEELYEKMEEELKVGE